MAFKQVAICFFFDNDRRGLPPNLEATQAELLATREVSCASIASGRMKLVAEVLQMEMSRFDFVRRMSQRNGCNLPPLVFAFLLFDPALPSDARRCLHCLEDVRGSCCRSRSVFEGENMRNRIGRS